MADRLRFAMYGLVQLGCALLRQLGLVSSCLVSSCLVQVCLGVAVGSRYDGCVKVGSGRAVPSSHGTAVHVLFVQGSL